MKQKIRVGILGYGNLGRGVELSLRQNADMELVAFFTRRQPESLTTLSPNVPVYPADAAVSMADKIDVLILCGGSATDLPVQSPEMAKYFHIVDSFDNHANIPAHFAACEESAQQTKHVAVISVGWDPGMFSLQRLLGNCILPDGADYTFWGRGVSQGHSDAIRRIEGVLDARQYTIPVPEALEQVRAGQNPELTPRQKHTRQCFVVAQEGEDLERIRQEIVTMPNYFMPYDTTVEFISKEEMEANHKGLPHGGVVVRTGTTGADGSTKQRIEYSLQLDSNPEFTASVLVAYARAAYRLAQQGSFGAKTVLDIPPALLSAKSPEELRKTLL